MGDGVLATDENGAMVLLNPAAQSMVGLEPTAVPLEERSRRIGIFRPGTEELYPADQMPLARASAR